jgi:hypothetical protein
VRLERRQLGHQSLVCRCQRGNGSRVLRFQFADGRGLRRFERSHGIVLNAQGSGVLRLNLFDSVVAAARDVHELHVLLAARQLQLQRGV